MSEVPLYAPELSKLSTPNPKPKPKYRYARMPTENGVPENSILQNPLFYKAALDYAQVLLYKRGFRV